MKVLKVAFLAVLSVALFTVAGCKKNDGEDDPKVVINTPDTYSFDNVSFSGQVARIDQLDEMMAYIETANSPGVELSAAQLKDMYANTGENGGGHFSFSSTKDLKSKTFASSVSVIEDYFDAIELASKSTSAAANGIAGRMFNEDSTSSRLFNENGWEYAEFIEKGIMGAVFYYQATTVYLGDDKMTVDNETVVEGEGTEMQHHWDEAYGYLGVTTDFPQNTSDVRYWGKYCVSRDAALNSVEELGTAFRYGRAAIDQNELTHRDSAIAEVRTSWERLAAGLAIHYLNATIENIGDDLERNHALSEAYVLIEGLKYNEERLISLSEIEEVTSTIGVNFYEVTTTDLISARDKLASIMGLEDIKTVL